VAGHHLIDAYLATLAQRLPADAIDELADGLTETYQRHRCAGLDRDAAATATIVEFGKPDQVMSAFVVWAPGRRTALVLLSSGPIVGGCWAASLIASHAWTWPIPAAARIAFAVTLLAVIVMLVLAVTGATSYRRTRIAVVAGIGLIGLDGAMLSTVLLIGPAFVWPMAIAVPASLVRMALTARVVPRILTG
jgi:hypothetical protein